MTIDVKIIGDSGAKALVTLQGQLVTAPISYSESIFNSLILDNVPVNYIEPKAGFQFVITEIIASGDKSVGTAGSLLEIYETDAIDSAISTKSLNTLTITKGDTTVIPNRNILTSPAVWINAIMDDNNVDLTISGYFLRISN